MAKVYKTLYMVALAISAFHHGEPHPRHEEEEVAIVVYCDDEE